MKHKYTYYRVVYTGSEWDYDRPRYGLKIYDTLEEAQKEMNRYHRITKSVGEDPQGPIEIRRVTEITEVVESSTV